MNRSAIMRASAVISFLFGIPLLIAPDVLVTLYGSSETLTRPGTYNSMLLGASLIAFGVANWVAAKVSYAEARAVVIGGLVFDLLGFAVALARQLMGVAPTTAWLNVAIFLVLAMLYLSILRGEHAPGTSRVTPT
jgi:hypothetical protein